MDDIKNLSDKELSDALKNLGQRNGPITKATRTVFESLLLRCTGNTNRNSESNGENPESDTNRSLEYIQHEAARSNRNVCENMDNVQPFCCYYGISCSESEYREQEKTESQKLVFTSFKDAICEMKRMKGSRLKCFSTRTEAEVFSLSRPNQTLSRGKSAEKCEPSLPFKSPTSQELVAFRKNIEKGNSKIIEDYLWKNPMYIVSSCQTPVIIHEGCRLNAMHAAVKANQLNICELIIKIINDDKFLDMTFPFNGDTSLCNRVKRRLLDYFLNCSEKGAGDTPLHIACKFGFIDIVRFLVSLPQTEKNKENKSRETPLEVICSRSKDDSAREIISDLLTDKVYVPLFRAEDDSIDPVVGKPVPTANNTLCKESRQISSPLSPLSPVLRVKAYAGPMGLNEADNFLREWKSPKKTGSFHNDFEKGKESIGRKLAESRNVPWTEYWSFLHDFADFKSEAGLNKLECYLKNRLDIRRKNQLSVYGTPARKELKHLSQFQTNGARLKAMNEFESVNKNGVDNECKKSLLHEFELHSPTDSENPRLESGTSTVDNNNDKVDFNAGDNLTLQDKITGENLCDVVNMMEKLDLNSPSAPTGNTTAIMYNPSIITTGQVSEGEEHLKSTVRTDCFETDRISANDSVFGNEMNDSLDKSNQSVFLDTSTDAMSSQNQYYDLQKHGNCSAVNSRHNLETPLFISGFLPSKLDSDVFKALGNTHIDHNQHPLVYEWVKIMNKYSIDNKNRWPSPCSPRYRSKIRKAATLWSL